MPNLDNNHYPRIVSRDAHVHDDGLTYETETLQYDTEDEAAGGADSYRYRGCLVVAGAEKASGGWNITVQTDGTTPAKVKAEQLPAEPEPEAT